MEAQDQTSEVHSILLRYADDEIILDAIGQWASDLTSYTAYENRHGNLERLRRSIGENIELRYGISSGCHQTCADLVMEYGPV